MRNIFLASESAEQNNSTVQFNKADQKLNNLTQENVVSSEEIAARAEELSNKTTQLKEIINFFRN